MSFFEPISCGAIVHRCVALLYSLFISPQQNAPVRIETEDANCATDKVIATQRCRYVKPGLVYKCY
jgi:hypothetical protein